MIEFLEDVLHINLDISKYSDTDKLPLVLQGSFNLFVINMNGERFILAEPKENLGLATLRKQQRRLEKFTMLYCVLYLKNLKSYTREKMLEEGIPFVWEKHQIYIPFLGILLKQNETRALKHVTKVSFLTQKFLLMVLYNQMENINVTKAADFLGVTKMSATRCFDEIESMELPVLSKKGRTRLINIYNDKKEMWKLIKPCMRNPLLQEFFLAEDVNGELLKSGDSALDMYSMLGDNKYKTYAITKSQLSEYEIKNKKQIPSGELPGCVVQELGYVINFENSGAVDPLTIYLIMESQIEEPRIELALNEMLEEHVW